MLGCGRSKSFIETHCSSLLWALFIPKKTTKFEMFGFIKFSKSIKPFSRSCLNGLFVCGSNPTEYTVLRQQARSNRRVQEVVRVKQKKNWNSIVLQRFEPPGFILRRSVGFWVFCGVALLSFGVSFSDIWSVFGCEGFWSSALADGFFSAAGPPWFVSSLKRPRRFFSGCCLRQ